LQAERSFYFWHLSIGEIKSRLAAARSCFAFFLFAFFLSGIKSNWVLW